MADDGLSDPLFLEFQTALAGRYSLDRELGRGGMGIVYLARDVRLDRLVAVKLLPPALAATTALRERFLREARTAAKLSHPNIVPIYAVDEAGEFVYFVMAYIAGETLGQRLRGKGPLSPVETARILRDVAWALAYAHAQGVIHRDVKPDNILLETGGRRALVADFGIASVADAQATDAEGVIGTVEYLSPEQAREDRVDGRSDLYSLAVVGYRTLAGRLPYEVHSLRDLLARQLGGPPPALGIAAPHAPRALCRAIDRMLAYEPSSRLQSGEEFAEALDQLETGGSELPAPLRIWLTRGSQPKSGLVGWSILVSVIGTMMILGTRGLAASSAGWIALIASAAAAFPWAVYSVNRLLATRKTLGAGYAHADLVIAIERHAERRREEVEFEAGGPSTAIGRAIRKVTLGSAAAVIGLCMVSPVLPHVGQLLGLTAGVTAVGLVFGRFIPGHANPPRAYEAEFRRWMWRGPLGKLMVKLAGGSRKGAAPEQVVHRPTELALGHAAEALFQALPATHRKDLKALPEQIAFLAARAHAIRGKIEELDDLIGHAAPDTLFGATPDGDRGVGPLREAREAMQVQLSETVTMLESIRIGLLRLHAGSASAESLTADLEAARALRDRLRMLSEGHDEIDALLPEHSPIPGA
ncbi:MAG: serine/threonine-protein kinase [Gemmatimonadota bacterium]